MSQSIYHYAFCHKMNRIRAGLREVFDQRPDIYEILVDKQNPAFVAGGIFSSWALCEGPKDLDIFFPTAEQVQKLHAAIWKRDKTLPELNFVPTPFTYTIPAAGVGRGVGIPLIQLISTYAGTPEEVLETFDFKHCTAYCSLAPEAEPVLPEDFDHVVNNMLLRQNSDRMPLLTRINKFVLRGWNIESASLSGWYELQKRAAERANIAYYQYFTQVQGEKGASSEHLRVSIPPHIEKLISPSYYTTPAKLLQAPPVNV